MGARHLVLTGFMGAGKSTVGPVVARRLGRGFVDVDAAVAAAAGRSVTEIFREQGEAAFRRLEAHHVRAALSTPEAAVVAVGGGALVDDALRAETLDRARVVLLTARVSTLVDRTRDESRPLLGDPDPARGIARLLSARRQAYAQCHARVSTDGVAVDATAAAVERAAADVSVMVSLGERSYAVRVCPEASQSAADLAASFHPSGVHVLTDATVGPLYAARVTAALEQRVEVSSFRAAAGEAHKRLATVEAFAEHVLGAGADRDALVVGIGGGVVTDMAGLAASLLLRGVRWIAIPTTLLAMVDAAVGGKTAVDIGPAKNAIGTFHQPCAVVAGIDSLATLARRHYVSGLAEAVKTAAVADPALLRAMERDHAAILERRGDALLRLVARCASVKARIVAEDERDSGARAVLGFGHTFGHALEAAGGFRRWTHGEAISLGRVAALRVGERLGVTPPALVERLVSLLRLLELPVELDGSAVESARSLLRFDKSRVGGRVPLALLRAVGVAILHPLPVAQLASLFEP